MRTFVNMNSRILLIVLSVLAVIEYYSYAAVNTALRNSSLTVRSSIITVYILISVAAIILVLNIRHWDTSGWNATLRTIIIAGLFGFILGKVLILVLMLADDVRRLFTWLYQLFFVQKQISGSIAVEGSGISRSQFMARTALLVGGLMMGGMFWGTRNKYRYKVKRVKLPLANLPASFRGLKIVQISDIHSGSFDNKEAVAHGVDLVMHENADMILFTGDLVNDRATEIEPYKAIFSRLKAPMGVYSTLGNHDYGDYVEWESPEAKAANLEKLKQHHAEIGWQLMMNEHRVFEREGEKIALLGIENWSAKARFPRHGDMKRAYAGLEAENIPVKILMSHDPSHWDAQVRTEYKDINLTLSGHTHGMQFGVLLPWMKWSPIKYVYKQWAGLYTEGNQHLYVNVGYGFLGYPGRLGILPEITVFELV